MPYSKLESILQSLDVYPVLGEIYQKDDFVRLDLSVDNENLNHINVSDANELERYIWNYIKTNNAKVAFGGYLEKRGIYNRSSHFNQQNSETERNIHLGVDLWIEAESPIYSPLDAEIHSFKNNSNYGDYGPTLILKHKIASIEFYSLYGHLSLASINDKAIGQTIKRGEQIATLGTVEVNGDYAPHLHFQIIKDLQTYKGDYPGVSNIKELDFYKVNCPNPKVLLKTN